jgi:hypothetical protein
MVSWGRAFKAALVLLAFTIAWGIVGAIIIGAGTFALAPSALSYEWYYGVPIPTGINWGALIGIIIVWIIGGLVIYLGSYASYFKILTELIVEETRMTTSVAAAPPIATQATQAAGAPTPTCPKCGTPLMYVQQYQRWYCPTCKEYQ